MPATPIDRRLIPVTGLMKSLPGMFGIRLDEEVKYYVISRDHDMQIRKYRPFILAQTMVRGSFDVARELGTKRLEMYLNGHNSFRERLSSTTPFFQSRGDKLSFTSPLESDLPSTEENWVLGIILPARFSIGNMPHPLEKNIKLLKIPSQIVAANRFSGINTQEVMDRETAKLLTWVENQKSYKAISEPRFAQYDGPIVIPLFRRNEIQISLIETDRPQKSFH
jgi:hypothetical protein